MKNEPCISQEQLIQLAHMVATEICKQPRLLNKEQLSQKLGYSVSTIDRLKAQGKIPYIAADRRVCFDLEAVIQALQVDTKTGKPSEHED